MIKVKILLEGHKIGKNLPLFVVFLEKLNFTKCTLKGDKTNIHDSTVSFFFEIYSEQYG